MMMDYDRLYEAFKSMVPFISYSGFGIYLLHNSIGTEGVFGILNTICGILSLCVGVFLYYMTYKKTILDKSKRIIIKDD